MTLLVTTLVQEDEATVTEHPTSLRQQAEAAHHVLRTRPRVLRLTPGQRDRIVREVRAEREERAAALLDLIRSGSGARAPHVTGRRARRSCRTRR
jgi:hypothetical protein